MLTTDWNTEPDPRTLLDLLHLDDPAAAVRVLCVCTRTVLVLLPEDETRPRVAIDVVEAWCDEKATLDDVRRASREAFEAAKTKKRIVKKLPPYGPGGIAAARAAANVGLAVTEWSANEALALVAAAFAAERDAKGPGTYEAEHAATLARLADLVRETVRLRVGQPTFR